MGKGKRVKMAVSKKQPEKKRQKKNVKKPAGAKPGFVVYYTNYSLMIDSDISGIEKISD